MDTRLHRAATLDKEVTPENRHGTASAAAAGHGDSAAVVTVGRSDRVVQPSTGPLLCEADPAFAGEPRSADGLSGPLTFSLAVADYDDHRIQLEVC